MFDLCDRDDRVRVAILTADPSAPSYCSGVLLVLDRQIISQLIFFSSQGDISGGWDSLWDPEAEKEGEHGMLERVLINFRSTDLPQLLLFSSS